jgi:starvation-inducible outer membrane lipoprotein
MKALLIILTILLSSCAEIPEQDIEEIKKQDATIDEGGEFEISIIEPDEKFQEEENE